ncbi:hypothetical protein AgCh_006152 [Apium graveolens]
MICCCTEYEVSRLGRFLSDTLRTPYLWKKNESIDMNVSAGICQVLLYIIDTQTASVLHMANLLRFAEQIIRPQMALA